MIKVYSITFSGFVSEVTADSEKDAWEQVKNYLHCYSWHEAKLVATYEPESEPEK